MKDILLEWKNLLFEYRNWFIAAFIFHLVSALFSVGYFHLDEHFQILEFLALKLGTGNAAHLPWEYLEKMRPWIQPFLYYLVSRIYFLLSGESPFVLAFIFRLLGALLGYISLFSTISIAKVWINNKSIESFLVKVTCSLWFLPFLHARTSSENWGSTFLIFAVHALIYNLKNKKLNVSALQGLIVGLLLGLSFSGRYQIGIIIFFMAIWAVFFGKIKLTPSITLTIGLVTAIGLGVLTDYWGYDQWVLAPYNYFHNNLVQDKVSGFGVSPWWDYFRLTLLRGYPPLSLFFIVCFCLFWWFYRFSVITFITLPFFIIHSAIGHKELRFLYPMMVFIPIIVSMVMHYLVMRKNGTGSLMDKCWKKLFARFLWGINFILLALSSLIPANNIVAFQKYLYAHREEINTIHALHERKGH